MKSHQNHMELVQLYIYMGCRNPSKSLKFLICALQSYLRIITDRFQIELLLQVYKLHYFLLLFWIQEYLRK